MKMITHVDKLFPYPVCRSCFFCAFKIKQKKLFLTIMKDIKTNNDDHKKRWQIIVCEYF